MEENEKNITWDTKWNDLNERERKAVKSFSAVFCLIGFVLGLLAGSMFL